MTAMARAQEPLFHSGRIVHATSRDGQLILGRPVSFGRTDVKPLDRAQVRRRRAMGTCARGHLGGRPEARHKRRKRRTELPAIATIATVAAITTAAAATAATSAITTTAAATATAVATASTTATGTFSLRAGFVHHEVSATEVLTVETVDCAIGIFIAGDFNESETAGLAGEAIANQADC